MKMERTKYFFHDKNILWDNDHSWEWPVSVWAGCQVSESLSEIWRLLSWWPAARASYHRYWGSPQPTQLPLKVRCWKCQIRWKSSPFLHEFVAIADFSEWYSSIHEWWLLFLIQNLNIGFLVNNSFEIIIHVLNS